MKTLILTKETAQKKLERIALEIAEDLFDQAEDLVVIGIAGSGMVVAGKLHKLLEPLLKMPIEFIACTLNKRHPEEITYSKHIDFNNKHVLVVDDVTNSGRTLLYALKPLLQGYPKSIRTMSLVERMHKHYPVKPDYIGLSVATTLQDHISVEVEGDDIVGAYLN